MKFRCFVARRVLSWIYALFGVLFPGLNMRWRTKNDRYQVCVQKNLTPPGIYLIHSMHIVFYTDHLQCYGCEEQQTSRKSNCTLECRALFRRCKRFANYIQPGHRQTRLHIVARKCEKCVKNICQAPNQSKHFFLCILTVFWTKILYIYKFCNFINDEWVVTLWIFCSVLGIRFDQAESICCKTN